MIGRFPALKGAVVALPSRGSSAPMPSMPDGFLGPLWLVETPPLRVEPFVHWHPAGVLAEGFGVEDGLAFLIQWLPKQANTGRVEGDAHEEYALHHRFVGRRSSR